MGANVHAQNDAALRCASCNGHKEVVKLLLDYGANIYINNNTPLIWAARNGYIEVVKILRKYYFKLYGNKFKCSNCLLKPVCTKVCDKLF